jgi:hypothetical protein
MKINAERLNIAHNMIKEMVGEQGAFILFAVKPDGEGEDLQIRIFGPNSRVLGLLEASSPYIEKHMREKISSEIRPLPAEPD